ncbi:hypothetical protein BSNK01_15240 [Bacillaceae bacterium]
MKVKCVLCDKIEEIDDESYTAKRLRNKILATYLCAACHKRIAEKTIANRKKRAIPPSGSSL